MTHKFKPVAVALSACLLSPVAGAADLLPVGGPWSIEVSGYDPNADDGGLYQDSGGGVGQHGVVIGSGDGAGFAASVNSGGAPVPFASAYAKGGNDVTATAGEAIFYAFNIVAASETDASALRSFLLGTQNHFLLDGTEAGRLSGDGIQVSGFASLTRDKSSYSGAGAEVGLATNYGTPVYGAPGPSGNENPVRFVCDQVDDSGCGTALPFSTKGGLISEGANSLVFSGTIYLSAVAVGQWNATGISGFLSDAQGYIDPLISLNPAFQGDPSHFQFTLSDGVVNATDIPPVPLPGTLAMFGGALVAALGRVRRRR